MSSTITARNGELYEFRILLSILCDISFNISFWFSGAVCLWVVLSSHWSTSGLSSTLKHSSWIRLVDASLLSNMVVTRLYMLDCSNLVTTLFQPCFWHASKVSTTLYSNCKLGFDNLVQNKVVQHLEPVYVYTIFSLKLCHQLWPEKFITWSPLELEWTRWLRMTNI